MTLSSVIQIMAEKFSGNAYSQIENKELRFERSGLLLIEVGGEAGSLELVKN